MTTGQIAVRVHPGAADSPRRAMLFAVHSSRDECDGATQYQLSQLRRWADRLVVITSGHMKPEALETLRGLCDRLVIVDSPPVDARAYRAALHADDDLAVGFDEVVFTGNGWFGPIGSFDAVMERMAQDDASMWRLIQSTDDEPESFPLEGFPRVEAPWTWTVVRRDAMRSTEWREYWERGHTHDENQFVRHFAQRGLTAAHAFAAAGAPRGNPGVLSPGSLLDAGCPVLLRAIFAQFPPLLDRFAVLLRPILRDVERRGYPMPELWRALVRTTQPAALNAIAGMLEVFPDGIAQPIETSDIRDSVMRGDTLRVCVVAHVPGLGFFDELAERLAQIPGDFDLVVTTTDGRKAARLRALLRSVRDSTTGRTEVRVVWVPGGRDIGALIVGCRDVMLSDEYDLIVRIHGRAPRTKSPNVAEYSRRYQLENLLNSPAYVQRILDLFHREPGLGLVFPPLIHVGYGTMGRGWGAYRGVAEKLCARLGISVPLDGVSPLAPYGGMWIGRPDALRDFISQDWTAADYHRSRRRKYVELTRVQERLLSLAAAEAGYHCRTVLTSSHAQIAFTSLEYKADEMFTTTRGYPVEQIHLLRRAGWTGHGGVVALVRMHVNLNHPLTARWMQPIYRLLRSSMLRLRDVNDAIRGKDDKGGARGHE